MGQFLRGHAHLSWLHEIKTGRYLAAATTLKGLAACETDLASRKKVRTNDVRLDSPEGLK